MDELFRFFSPEARERRGRAAADLGLRLEKYVPPNLRPLVGLLAESTPTMTLDRAARASGSMLAPDRTPMQRVGDFGEMLSETASIAAPMAVANRAGIPVAEAIQEGLLGLSVPGAGDALAKPVMAAGRRAADIARRVEVDPNAFGSMGGNIRLRPQASIDDQVAAARQAVLDNPNDPALFDEYKRIRRVRDEGVSTFPQVEAPATRSSSGLLDDYVGQHRAPTRDAGAPAFNLAGDIYPDDIYSSKAVQYYGTGSGAMDNKTMSLLQSLRGKPDADVTIYRAVPKGVDSLNAGDWVTVSKQYAKDHGESALGGDFDIIEKKVKAKDIFTNGDSIHEFGYDPSTPAQEVAGLLSSGRVDEVTDEMLAKFTPNDEMELFDLYQRGATGMDLPMDEASRMARKSEIGHGRDLFHGGAGGYNYLSADAGTGKTSGTGAFLSPSNLLAETYSPHRGGAVYPVSSRSSAPIVSADMQDWNNIEAPVYAYDPRTMDDVEVISEMGRASTDDIAREARGLVDAIEIQDVSDRGPRAWGMTQYPPISDIRVEYDPANIRSRFARFDPRLAHLRNLSAGVGGLGLLSSIIPQEEQY